LRTAAVLDPGFFREAYALARERYEEDRASYHVSAEPARTPEPREPSDEELPSLLEDFDAREILHVTFGSVLEAERGDRLHELLRSQPEAYATNLRAHFLKHLLPFVGNTSRGAAVGEGSR